MSIPYIGATSSAKYYKEDFNDYVADPSKSDYRSELFGGTCMPVGINDTFMPTDKADADNLDKTQYNIRERFGYLSAEDYENDD